MLAWSSDNHQRLETVRTVLSERGLRANGYIISGAGDSGYGCSYSILADAQGRTRRLSVQSDVVDGERHLSLTRTPGGPWVLESTSGTTSLPVLDAAQDIDIQTSAFTNSLALRRLGLTGPDVAIGTETTVVVARVSMPSLTVIAAETHYTVLGRNQIGYSGTLGDLVLTLDDDGFVIDFPHLTHRIR